jgi:hypothetical protein
LATCPPFRESMIWSKWIPRCSIFAQNLHFNYLSLLCTKIWGGRGNSVPMNCWCHLRIKSGNLQTKTIIYTWTAYYTLSTFPLDFYLLADKENSHSRNVHIGLANQIYETCLVDQFLHFL